MTKCFARDDLACADDPLQHRRRPLEQRSIGRRQLRQRSGQQGDSSLTTFLQQSNATCSRLYSNDATIFTVDFPLDQPRFL